MKNKNPIETFCDKDGTFALTKEPRDHVRSMNIKRMFHYIREKVEDVDLIVK